MTPSQKQLNLLGLATRAKQLISGDEFVEKAIKSKQVYLVICACDASQATLERYQGYCQRNQIPLFIEFNKNQISHAIGKSRTICAFANQGMAQRFLSYRIGEESMDGK
ncbi:L7Ae/L30e/S12e/Gadd45 family ribosomal protein [Vaginisenegalia massiliensis]|uniref:L7Ae/L30e/S12e/Gadd45 family ribosomal protein n=1 Tax=Vaginisenegalia massiliensis TaxID=2058294 RepID=UPI000F53D3A4|nr:ribosomal L7Ae/L30e/S12e/Gadd45 family protein [Vaginisenegalia massiliensis]